MGTASQVKRYSWKIIETKSDAARVASRSVGELGLETYLPEYRDVPIAGVRKTRNVFPGYCFVRMPRDLHDAVVWACDDVKKLFRQPVTNQFIADLRSMEDAKGYLEIERLEAWLPGKVVLRPGQPVRGRRGLLENIAARFVEYVDDTHARASVVLFGGLEVMMVVPVHELVGA